MSRRKPWVDWVAVERATEGQPVGRALTYHERCEAIARLAPTELTAAEIAARVGLTPAAIKKHRGKVRRT